MRVLFLHPNLGIGGAERLVVDAGLALQRRGHSVQYVTAHHDRRHCFPETLHQLAVTVRGAWIPDSVCGRLRALCACLRMLYAALCVLLLRPRPQLVVVDQVSACVPLLRAAGLRVLFYCHFPDQLLTERRSLVKRLYRAPLDGLEAWSTGCAHRLLVNSRFTAAVVAETFPRLADRPEVLYPSLDLAAFDQPSDVPLSELLPGPPPAHLILSINRFERKKRLSLAVDALAELRRRAPPLYAGCRLVLAGGFDPRSVENAEHLRELQQHARTVGVDERVTFLRSPSDAAKRTLLRACSLLVYTPEREHFGIVPLEAMYSGAPVVAAASGGPLETVLDGVTGLLRPQQPQLFAAAFQEILSDPERRRAMGEAGRRHVADRFSFQAFGDRLETISMQVAMGADRGGGVDRDDGKTD